MLGKACHSICLPSMIAQTVSRSRPSQLAISPSIIARDLSYARPVTPYSTTFHGALILTNQDNWRSPRLAATGAADNSATWEAWRGSGATRHSRPSYQVLQKKNYEKGYECELRLYSPYHVIQTSYERRGEGIASLMSYIEGGNEANQWFPPTQPLLMRYKEIPGGGFEKTMEIYLADTSNPPPPTTGGVQIDVVGGELLAALEFPGETTPAKVTMYYRFLRSQLEEDGLKVDGNWFRLATYGPIFSLSEKRNELLIKVTP